ncbi:MAG: branched-chain amino acid transport system ATP-binding protein, partial [Acidimicrobiaceae bacterium]|nr:branched-chain amino acid transport system ATP-binding protein [Acidimicrobiaceae bacterium]
EVVGIIGPNGSGKTTLFNLLSGFLRPRSGSIRWEGQDVTKAPAHVRARRGLVRTFQESMVFPGLTVRENLEMAVRAAHLNGQSPQSVGELLDYVRIGHVVDSLAADLSWGQTRLLGIALALALRPKVLLLDEPFAGLSPVAAEDVSVIIRRLRSDGYSLCVIDHEMTFLLPICDRLVVLANGTTLADGPPGDVIERPDVRAAYLGI